MNVILPTTDWYLALVLGRPEAGGGLSRQSHLSCIPINPSQSLVKLWHPVGEILISGEFLGPWLWRSGWPSCLLEEVKGSIQPIATVIDYGVPWQRSSALVCIQPLSALHRTKTCLIQIRNSVMKKMIKIIVRFHCKIKSNEGFVL